MEKLDQIRELIQKKSNFARKPDRDAQRLLLYVFTAMRGGLTRLQIINLLSETPLNTNQISEKMNLDYKAIQHHLINLEKNNLVTRIGQKYGSTFHLSNYLEANILALEEVVKKLERQLNRKIVYL